LYWRFTAQYCEIIVFKIIKLDISGLEFPVTNKGIIHFEKNNADLRLNTFKTGADCEKFSSQLLEQNVFDLAKQIFWQSII